MKAIKQCRACGSELLHDFLDLGKQYLSDFRRDGTKTPKYPLVATFCERCTLVQLRHTTPQYEMYHDRYGFKSGVSDSIKQDLDSIVTHAFQYQNDPRKWLDIASNDGTLLSFVPEDVYRVGVDPVTFLCEEAEQYSDEIVNDYFSAECLDGYSPFDVITSVSCFYDMPDPNKFVSDVATMLDKHGVWIIQQNYLMTTVELSAVDNFCLGRGELVTTIDGNKPIETIEKGDYVLTHLGRFRKVVKKFVNKNKDGELVRLRAYGAGYDLNATKNHPIYVKRNDEWTFVPAEDVKIGDVVGKPVVAGEASSSKILPGKSLANLGKITGYYLAEGSYYKQKKGGNVVTFSFNQNEENTHIADLVEALTAEGYSANLYQHPGTSVITVTTYGEIAKWLKENFKSHALRKTIPMDSLMWGKEFLSNLLTCYMNGDGYEYRDGYLRASTVGKDLAYGISLVANKLGYKCSITECKKDPEGVILGRKVHINNLWDILVSTKPQKKLKVWMEDGIQCMRIRKIELVPYNEESVYNLEVEEDHTFVTPAMATHNCHEHLEYYTLNSLENLLNKHGLEVNEVYTSMVNGGSIRTVVSHKGTFDIDQSVYIQRDKEDDTLLNTLDTYKNFAKNVTNELNKLHRIVKEFKDDGKTVYILAASTRGATIWQSAEIDGSLIEAAVERNPAKVGAEFTAIGVPIISEEEARANKPDYMIIGPWFFDEEIIKREAEYLKSGGKLIKPLPKVEIIDSSSIKL